MFPRETRLEQTEVAQMFPNRNIAPLNSSRGRLDKGAEKGKKGIKIPLVGNQEEEKSFF